MEAKELVRELSERPDVGSLAVGACQERGTELTFLVLRGPLGVGLSSPSNVRDGAVGVPVGELDEPDRMRLASTRSPGALADAHRRRR